MSRGCCNECGYKADYIIDKNNYEDNSYEDLDQVPFNKMLCGVCVGFSGFSLWESDNG